MPGGRLEGGVLRTAYCVLRTAYCVPGGVGGGGLEGSYHQHDDHLLVRGCTLAPLLRHAAAVRADALRWRMRRHLYHFGLLPEAFRRSTPRSALLASITTQFLYAQERGMRGFRRSITAA